MPTMMLAFLLVWPFTTTPTPAPKAAVAAKPTLPPRPAPNSYEQCEKALDRLREYCEDSYPTYCERRVPKLSKE